MGCGATKDSVAVTHTTVNAKVQKININRDDDDEDDNYRKKEEKNTLNNIRPNISQQTQNKPGFQQIDIKYSNNVEVPTPTIQINTSNRNILDNIDSTRSYTEKSSRDRLKSPADLNEPNLHNTSKNNLFESDSQIKSSIAFTIALDDKKTLNSNMDNVLTRPILPKFKLEPLNSKPKLTQEQIDEKMRAVELKREEMLAKRIEVSKTTSERKVSIQQKQQSEQTTSIDKIENSINSANKNREEKLEEIVEKQRRQDERRRRVMRAYRERTTEELENLQNNDFETDANFNGHNEDEDF